MCLLAAAGQGEERFVASSQSGHGCLAFASPLGVPTFVATNSSISCASLRFSSIAAQELRHKHQSRGNPMQKHEPDHPKLGLVLGAGAAKGWAHIGVLQALEQHGIKPDIVCGCSSGALVGASYVTGHLNTLAELVEILTWRRVLGYLDFTWSGGGLIKGRSIVKFFENNLEDIAIENASPVFGAVAADLHSGRETWFTRGS